MSTSALDTPPALQIHNLSVWYTSTQALKDISGTLEPGALAAIIGPNGGGKSTLLKAMMGLVSSVRGTITPTASALRGLVAYLPQQAEIDRTFPLRVEDFVATGLWRMLGNNKAFDHHDHHRVHEVLDRVGLAGFEERPLDALSGGQFQRVLFARLMLQDAPIIFLDEPFTGIDAQTTHDLLHLVLDWHHQGRTVVAVLHDLDSVQAHFKTAILLSQTLLGWGPTAEVLGHVTLQKVPLCQHGT